MIVSGRDRPSRLVTLFWAYDLSDEYHLCVVVSVGGECVSYGWSYGVCSSCMMESWLLSFQIWVDVVGRSCVCIRGVDGVVHPWDAPEEDKVLDEALQRASAHALVQPRRAFRRHDLLEHLDRAHVRSLIVLAFDVRGHLGLGEVQWVDAEGGEEAAEAADEGALQGALAVVAH